jgi:hypothetical protein
MTDWLIPQSVLGWDSPLAWILSGIEVCLIILLYKYCIKEEDK